MNEIRRESHPTTPKKQTNHDHEVDAYDNPTELFQWINFGRWDKAVKRTKMCPSEASVWIVSRNDNGDLKWKYLPLHMVCLQPNPPRSIIKSLIHAFPKGARCRDYDGNLPIHYLCAEGCNNGDVLETLIAAYPESLHQKDKYGRNPLQIVEQDESIDKIDSDIRHSMINILLRRRNHTQIQLVESRDETPAYEKNLEWEQYQMREDTSREESRTKYIQTGPLINRSPSLSSVKEKVNVKINKNKTYVQELEAKVARLERAVAVKENLVQDLEVKAARNEEERLKYEFHTKQKFEAEIDRERQGLRIMEKSNLENQWKYEKKIRELESFVRINNTSDTQVLDLQSKLVKADEEKREMNQKSFLAIETIAKLESDNSQMRAKIQGARPEDDAQDLESQLTSYGVEIESLKRRLKNTSEENSEYEMKLGERKVVTQEVITLRDKVKTLTQECNKYQTHSTECERALMLSRVKSSDLEGRLEEIRMSSSNKDKQLDILHTRSAERESEIQAYAVRVMRLETSLEESKTRSTAMEGVMNTMRDEMNNTVRAEHSEHSINLNRLHELEPKLKASMGEITSLKIRMDSTTRENASYSAKFQDLKAKHDKETNDLCEQLSSQSSNAAALRENIIRLSDENCACKKKLDEQRVDFDSKLLAVKKAVSLQANAFATLQNSVSNSDDDDESICSLEEGMHDNRRSLISAVSTATTSRGRYEAFNLEDQVRDLASEKYVLETELENLRNKFQIYKEDNSRLKARIEYLGGKQHELNSTITMMEEIKEKDSNQSGKISELVSRNAELEKDCKLLEERVKQLYDSEQAEKENVRKIFARAQSEQEKVKEISARMLAEKETIKKTSEKEQAEKEKAREELATVIISEEKIKALKDLVKKNSSSYQIQIDNLTEMQNMLVQENEAIKRKLQLAHEENDSNKIGQNQVDNLTKKQDMLLQENDTIKMTLKVVNEEKDSFKRRLHVLADIEKHDARRGEKSGDGCLGQAEQQLHVQVDDLAKKNKAYQEQLKNLVTVNESLKQSEQCLKIEMDDLTRKNKSQLEQINDLIGKVKSSEEVLKKNQDYETRVKMLIAKQQKLLSQLKLQEDQGITRKDSLGERKWEQRAKELQNVANNLMRKNNVNESRLKELSIKRENESLTGFSLLRDVTETASNAPHNKVTIEELWKEKEELGKINAALFENVQDLTKKCCEYKKKIQLLLANKDKGRQVIIEELSNKISELASSLVSISSMQNKIVHNSIQQERSLQSSTTNERHQLLETITRQEKVLEESARKRELLIRAMTKQEEDLQATMAIEREKIIEDSMKEEEIVKIAAADQREKFLKAVTQLQKNIESVTADIAIL